VNLLDLFSFGTLMYVHCHLVDNGAHTGAEFIQFSKLIHKQTLIKLH